MPARIFHFWLLRLIVKLIAIRECDHRSKPYMDLVDILFISSDSFSFEQKSKKENAKKREKEEKEKKAKERAVRVNCVIV